MFKIVFVQEAINGRVNILYIFKSLPKSRYSDVPFMDSDPLRVAFSGTKELVIIPIEMKRFERVFGLIFPVRRLGAEGVSR